ncbi:MAG: hypothetical protein WAV73_04875 [Candidatus Moraniibacteriota bacterium]
MKNSWPNLIKSNAVGFGAVPLDGLMIPYAVLSRAVNKDLVGFIGCFKYEDDQHYFISEDVPTEFREPQILHELNEIHELKEEPGSCLKSLLFELRFVGSDIREKYLAYRRDFFRRLVHYCAERPEWYSEQRRADFQESLDYLNGLIN